ncbi:MAG: hypothetical protein K0S81_2629, partial [Rhodospirillales bacterium]|nr:hypothetical protein [Rhodospirillales bacterium]
DRILVRREYFGESFMRDFLRMSAPEFDLLFEGADQRTRRSSRCWMFGARSSRVAARRGELVDPIRRHLSFAPS